MANPFLGEIRCFGFGFAPANWAQCNGQLLSIAQSEALFAILGTIYGGNGVTNFALPNLQGQIPMHWGTTGGVSPTIIGQIQGTPSLSITTDQLAPHNHTVNAAHNTGTNVRTAAPAPDAYFGPAGIPDQVWAAPPPVPPADSQFGIEAITPSGGSSQSHDNMQPYLVLNFCISLQGMFPSAN